MLARTLAVIFDTLGNDLTVEVLEEFLANLARGHEYGAVPLC